LNISLFLSLSDEFFFFLRGKRDPKVLFRVSVSYKTGTRAFWKRKKRSQQIFKFALSHQTKRERDKEIKQRDKTEERKAHAHAIEVTRARAKPNRVRVSNGKKTQIQI